MNESLIYFMILLSGTLDSIITSRADTLTESHKMILKIASIVGRVVKKDIFDMLLKNQGVDPATVEPAINLLSEQQVCCACSCCIVSFRFVHALPYVPTFIFLLIYCFYLLFFICSFWVAILTIFSLNTMWPIVQFIVWYLTNYGRNYTPQW